MVPKSPELQPVLLLRGFKVAVAGLLVFFGTILTPLKTIRYAGDNRLVDFHCSVFNPGRLILHGHYPVIPISGVGHDCGTVYPPAASLMTLPFALPPYQIAAVLWAVFSIGCVLGAVRTVGCRDWRIYVLVCCSWFVTPAIVFGNWNAPLLLLAALTWRWRGQTQGGLVLACAVAAKLFMWPLIIWLLIKHRRAGIVALGATPLVLFASWAVFGFHGLTAYPALARANVNFYAHLTPSAYTLLMHAGFGKTIASLSTFAACAACLALAARSTDQGGFALATLGAVVASPIAWGHYYGLMLIALAAAVPSIAPVWLLPSVIGVSATAQRDTVVAAILSLAIGAAIAGRASSAPRPSGHPPRTDWRGDRGHAGLTHKLP